MRIKQQGAAIVRDARRTEADAVHRTLPESPCFVLGQVAFADGGTGSWQLDRLGLGWLDRADAGRMVLYCRGCRTSFWTQ